jgi:hypothetical protein
MVFGENRQPLLSNFFVIPKKVKDIKSMIVVELAAEGWPPGASLVLYMNFIESVWHQ